METAEPVELDETDAPNALRVWVWVPDDTPDEQLTWPNVRSLEESIKRVFGQVQTFYYPVIGYRRESETDESTD